MAALVVGVLAAAPSGSFTVEMTEVETERALAESGITAQVVVSSDGVLIKDAERRGDGQPVDPSVVAAIVWTRHTQQFDELVVRTVDGPERVFARNELRTSLGPRPADLTMFPSSETADDTTSAEPFLMPIRILAIGIGVAAAGFAAAMLGIALSARGLTDDALVAAEAARNRPLR